MNVDAHDVGSIRLLGKPSVSAVTVVLAVYGTVYTVDNRLSTKGKPRLSLSRRRGMGTIIGYVSYVCIVCMDTSQQQNHDKSAGSATMNDGGHSNFTPCLFSKRRYENTTPHFRPSDVKNILFCWKLVPLFLQKSASPPTFRPRYGAGFYKAR